MQVRVSERSEMGGMSTGQRVLAEVREVVHGSVILQFGLVLLAGRWKCLLTRRELLPRNV